MKFSLRFTKIIATTILTLLIGGIVLPAGFAFAQSPDTSGVPLIGIPVDETSSIDKTKDKWAFFKELFNTPVNGISSGVSFLRPDVFGDSGVSSASIQVSLVMDRNRDLDKDKNWQGLYYDATAAEAENMFVLVEYPDASGVKQAFGKFTQVENEPADAVYSVDEKTKAKKNKENKIYYYNGATSGIFKKGDLIESQTAVTKVTFDKDIPFKTDMKVSFWYCAGIVDNGNNTTGHNALQAINYTKDASGKGIGSRYGYSTFTAPTDERVVPIDTTKNPRNKEFAEMCRGTMAYRIGPAVTYNIPNLAAAEAANKVELQSDVTSRSTADIMPSCGIIVGKGTFMGCIALIVYHLFFRLAAFFAYLTGNIFDFFLGFSISSDAYSSSFVTAGWETVRDIANIFFIVLLIYVAIGSVFNINGVSKKLVGAIIINAILINFSLLITRGLIDISNIAARVFYSQIQVQNKSVETNTIVSGGNAEDVQYVGDSGYKSVSTIMLQSFDPQVVFDRAVMQQPATVNDADTTTGSANFASNQKNLSSIRITNPEEYAGYFALVTLICAFIAFTTGMIFWSIGFIFIGRVVGLYISMIFSPFAFMSRDIPFLKIMDKWHFSAWMSDLTKYLISAPITVIYFYVVIQIMQSDFYSSKISTNATTATSFTATVLWITIPLIIIYGLLSKGKDMINSFAGETGKLVGDLVKKGVGIAGGAALGVTALGGSRLLGKAASAVDSGAVGRMARSLQENKSTAWLGRRISSGLKAGKEGSFDVRNTATGQSLFKGMGLDTNSKMLASVGLGADAAKGGYEAKVKKDAAKKQEREELMRSQAESDDDKKKEMDEYNARAQSRYETSKEKTEDEAKAADYANKKAAYDTYVADIEQRMLAQHGQANINTFKANGTYDVELENLITQQNVTRVAEPGKEPKSRRPATVESIDELDSARRADYAKSLKDGGALGVALQTAFGGASGAAIGAAIGTALLPGLGSLAGAWIGGVAGAGYRGIDAVTSQRESDKKAAKKLEEFNKNQKKLDEIKNVINKGLNDLIAQEKFNTDHANLTDVQKAAVKAEMDRLNDKKNAGEKADMIELVEATEKNKFDMKQIQKDLKTARKAFEDSMAGIAGSLPVAVARQRLKAQQVLTKEAEAHKSTWNDVSATRKKLQAAAKGEESKS